MSCFPSSFFLFRFYLFVSSCLVFLLLFFSSAFILMIHSRLTPPTPPTAQQETRLVSCCGEGGVGGVGRMGEGGGLPPTPPKLLPETKRNAPPYDLFFKAPYDLVSFYHNLYPFVSSFLVFLLLRLRWRKKKRPTLRFFFWSATHYHKHCRSWTNTTIYIAHRSATMRCLLMVSWK